VARSYIASPWPLGPFPDAARLVTVVQQMNDLQVAVDEHRCPWPQRRLRDLRIAPDNVGGHDIVGDEQPTLRVEFWRTLDCAATAASGLLLTLGAGHRGCGALCSVRTAARAATPAEEFGFLGVVLDRDTRV
jgi:hypothetical protein